MDVCQLASGSFALTQAEPMEDAVLFLFDPDGELVFEQTNLRVPGRALESGGWIQPVADGGCYVCAYSEPRATGMNSDIALFKLSASGEIEWSVMVGKDSDAPYFGIGVAATDNGGCALLGASSHGYGGAFLRKYSSLGSIEWDINFLEFENYYAIAVYSAGDGFLVFLGHEWEETALVLRLDSNGDIEWSAEIPYDCGFGPSAFAEIPGGYRVYLSYRESRNTGVSASIGFDGNLLEAVQFIHGVDVYEALVTDEGSIVLAGSRNINGEELAVVEAYDVLGEPLWSRRMDSTRSGFTGVCLCSDGGYGLSGHYYPASSASPLGTVFVKTGPDGIFENSADPDVIPMPVDEIEVASFCMGWVLACGVYQTENEAFERALAVSDEIEAGLPGALWIPHWGSLSGYQGWLSGIISLPAEGLSSEQIGKAIAICPDSYMVWVGMSSVSGRRMSLTDYTDSL